MPNRAQYLSDVIAQVVFWRPRYCLTLSEMFLERGIILSHKTVQNTKPFGSGRLSWLPS
jgi:transposase-like protein